MAVDTAPRTKSPSGKENRGHFWKGVMGMGAALLVVFAIRNLFPLVPYPPARIADLLIKITPGDFATFFIERLGKGAIRSLGVGVNIVAVLAGGGLGILVGRKPTSAGKAKLALAVGAAMFAVSMLLTLGTQAAGSFTAALVYLVAAVIFAKIAAEVPLSAAIEPKRVEGDETPLDTVIRSRRSFIIRMTMLIAGLVAGGGILRVLKRGKTSDIKIAPAAKAFDPPPPDLNFPSVPGLASEITANEDFYNVDINIVKPVVDHNDWELKIGGMVGSGYTLNYESMQKDFEVVEEVHTLSCISNEVGGHLISTAVWRGVRLKDVLERARPGMGIIDIVFRGAEGYSDSIPLAKAMEDTTLLVFGMNGEALPRDHGFPARIIVPGIYGMKNVKWLTSIEAVGDDYQGYWMVRGWSDVARVKTASRIDTPQDTAYVPSGKMMAGVAWAGDRGIKRVEISEDRGETWMPAVMKRELGPLTWRLWASELKHGKGKVRVLVRAVDGEGAVQSSEPARPHPDGASGYHFVDLTVE